MSTFSQIVDELVLESLRPDLRETIASFLNNTIREVHFMPARSNVGNNTILYEANRVEVAWPIPSTPAVWPLPSDMTFQRFEFAFAVERNCVIPKKSFERAFKYGIDANDLFWYRSGPNIVFNSLGVAETVNLMYYAYPKRLKYYLNPSDRPCQLDYENETYTYASDFNTNSTTRENARNLCTNWLLLRWHDILKAGVRAKIYARLGDDVRAKTHYSAFEALRMSILAGETYESVA